MIVDALKNPIFGMLVSFMLGLAIVVIVAPICHGKECMVIRAPPIHEVRESVYHIASKCYKFETVQMECPAQGVVEAFENVKKSSI
jgi:serine/threonine-protein kinase RIO1